MKILELHYSTAAAGAERFLVDISNELSLNHEVVLCTTDDDSVLENSFYMYQIYSLIGEYINLYLHRDRIFYKRLKIKSQNKI